ncbi:MAG: heme biosynthesis HemY N-terminal domain-containing protein [Pseudomonadota bacterium]
MLWSLIKLILFVVAVAALAMGAGYLLETEGGVQITALGSEYTFGPLQSVIAIVVMLVLVWIVLKLLSLLVATFSFLNGDETALSRWFDRGRERKGYAALSEGMMALASGEGRVAMSKAAKAERLLQKPELTNLLAAQAAEMAGDRRKAEETYKKLVANDITRFVGVRGIMKQKLADGDEDMAFKLAEKAFTLKPKHEEVQDVLLKLQAGKKDWSGARETLAAKLRHGVLPRDVHKRRDAVLALSQAIEAGSDESVPEVQVKAIEANKLSPDLVPAAVMAAKSNVHLGRPKLAVNLLKKAWEANPHPDLAAAFASIEPNERASERIKRFSILTRLKPEHPETKMLLAELNIANEDFPAARRALADLVETAPTARSVTLMAAIEKGEGAADAVVRGWLAKALTVSRGPQWICEVCQHIHAEWVAFCEHCGSFDTLAWKETPSAEVSMPAGAQMLPLIVGALEDKASPEPTPEPEFVEEIDAVATASETEPPETAKSA